jgi:hypothetical protein
MDKQYVLFLLGTIVSITGVAIAFFQLYITNSINSIRHRLRVHEENIEKLWELNRTCTMQCEYKREKMKAELRSECKSNKN